MKIEGVDWKETFVERYVYAQGKSDLPLIYHRHVAISILASCLQNRVWLEFYKGSPLYPNLYTFLVGPSGVGKGRAISAGMSLLEGAGLTEEVGMLGGSLTSAALMDFLSSKGGRLSNSTSRVYLVHPELSSSIKWGEHSDALVKRLTDLFTGDLSNYSDGTRTHRFITAGKPCINWLAGSTRRWLVTNLRSDVMAGGFMARGLFVEVLQKPPRQFLPIYPPDYGIVMNDLQDQLVNRVYRLSGEFIITQGAMEYLQEWYMNRPEPKSEEALASWHRHRELSLKVAMVLSAGTDSTKLIRVGHLYEAVQLIEEIKAGERDLWDFVAAGGKVLDFDLVAQKIAYAGEIAHSELLRMLAPRGINARRLWEIINMLEQQDRVETKLQKFKAGYKQKSVPIYKWISSKPTVTQLRREDEWE